MHNKASFYSHGAHKPHFQNPHAMHTEPHISHKAQQKQASYSSRYQRRHSTESSEEMGDTQKKIWAIFFIFLLASNDPTSSYRQRLRSVEPKNSPKNPSSENPRIIKPIEHTDYSSALSSLTSGLASLALGPVGGLLAFASTAAAADATATQDIPHEDLKFLDPMPAGLGGKALKKGLSTFATSYDTDVQKHHESTETILENSALIASTLIGACRGAPAGPVGIGIGALSGAAIHLTAEWGGKALHELFPEEIDSVVNKAINTMARPLQTISPSLNEEQARIAVSGGVIIGLYAFHLHSVGKAVGEGMFMAGAEEMFVHGLKESATETMMTGPSWIETPLEPPIDYTKKPFSDLLPDFPGEPNGAFYQLLHKVKKNSLEHAAQSAKKTMEATVEVGRKRQQLEKEAAQMDVSQREAAHIELIRAQESYQQTKNTFTDGIDAVSSLLHILGNHKEATQFINAGHATVKIIDSLHQISLGTSAISSAASGFATGASFGPYVALASGILSFVASLSSSDDTNPYQEIHNTLLQIHKSLSSQMHSLSTQIEGFHEDVIKGMNEVKNQISIFEYYTMLGFFKTEQHIQDLHVSTSYFLGQIDRHIKVVSDVLKPIVAATLVQQMVESCEAIDLYQIHTARPLQTMIEAEIRKHCGVLESAIRGRTIPHNCFNGYSCKDFTPEFINRNLKSLQPGDLLGYLAQLAASISNIALPTTVEAETLPNMKLFFHEANHYLTLRRAIPDHIHYDDQDTMLAEATKVGDRLQQFIEYIQNNKPLFENLLKKIYKANWDALQPTFLTIFERKAQEILETVYKKADSLNHQDVESFPTYKKIHEKFHFEGPSAVECFSADKDLESRYKTIKPDLLKTSEKHLENKQQYKISLENAKNSLLTNRTPLSAFVIPNSTQKENLLPIPLEFARIALKVTKYIPDDAIIGERLDLGILNLHYSTISEETISVHLSFKKTNNSILHLGMMTLNGKCTSPLASYTAIYPDGPWPNHPGQEEMIQKYIDSHTLSPHRLRSVWENAEVTNWAPDLEGIKNLSTFVDAELVKIRKETLFSLFYEKTALSAPWHQNLEALDAPVHLLKAFAQIAGFEEPEILELSKLLSGEAISAYHKQYLSGDVTEETPLLPLQTEEMLDTITSSILSRFNHTHAPSENSFSTPLIDLLSKFSTFSITHKQTIQKRKKEKVYESPEVEHLSSQEVAALRHEIKDLRSQIDEITALMKQLLLNQKKE